MSEVKICWISLDPVRRKIDYYPKYIANKIEESFNKKDFHSDITNSCILGSEFYNATIHIHNSGQCFQTTPGMHLGRAGYKPPGYRSVKRCILNNNNNEINIYSKEVNHEWRITNYYYDSDYTLNELVPQNCILNSINSENNIEKPTYWKNEDLNNNNFDLNIVIWQWCRGTSDKQGNLMLLDDSWWVPYLYEQNKIIEESYNSNNFEIELILPSDSSKRTISMNNNSCYGYQIRYENNIKVGERLIRRKIINLQEFKELLDKINNLQLDPTQLTNILSTSDIPNEFYCCITQDIMTNPVKTVDGHTYDKFSIERWLQNHNTSPLTGLILSSKHLEPNIELKNEIEKFTALNLDKKNVTNNV